MSGTYSNAPCKKGIFFSIPLAILVEFLVISLFHETKILIVDWKVQVSSNFREFLLKKIEIPKLHEEWKIQHFQVKEQASKNGGVVHLSFQNAKKFLITPQKKEKKSKF